MHDSIGIMGPHTSKKKDVMVPDNYYLLRVITFNLDLQTSISLKKKIERIINYIRDNDADIICFQNINDWITLKNLITHFKIVYGEKNIEIHTAPEFEDMEKQSVKRTLFISHFKSNKIDFGSNDNVEPILIISRYPIHSYCMKKLGDDGFCLVGNIDINNKIISFIGVTFISDIHSMKISNRLKRGNQIDQMYTHISANQQHLRDMIPESFSDISLILGNINISEINEDGDISDEYAELITKTNVVDLFRYKHEEDIGITSITNRRNDYMMFVLTNDIFEEGTELNEEFMRIEEPQDMFRFLFKRYSFHCVDISVNSETPFANFPVEALFMLRLD